MVGASARVNPLVVDGLLAAAILGLTLFAATLGHPQAGRRDPDAVAFALIVVACVPLMVRRRSPVPVLWTVSAAALAYAAIGYPTTWSCRWCSRPTRPPRSNPVTGS